MAAFKKGQKYEGAYSEAEFSESKVQGLSRDAYNPGSQPNVYVENSKGKNSIQLSTDSDNQSRSLNRDWHELGGWSGRVHKTNAGFAQGGPAGNHPRTSSKGSWPSVGADSKTESQGSVPGTPFKWR